MIKIKEAIIVEGKYDVQNLKKFVDTVILQTSGFRIFKDKERLQMIRKIAQKRGIIILTDSDGAGLVIRNYLKGAITKEHIKNVYIPEIIGKEKRKRIPSKAGTIGVEGMSKEILYDAFVRAGVTIFGVENNKNTDEKITKADLYILGLCGQTESDLKRKTLLKQLGLPNYLSTNALIDFLNAVSDKKEIMSIIKNF